MDTDTTVLTPEQHRENLARIGYQAEHDRFIAEGIPVGHITPWDNLPDDAKASYRAITQAVAAQVLRDALNVFNPTDNAHDWNAAARINQFSHDHGIDLDAI